MNSENPQHTICLHRYAYPTWAYKIPVTTKTALISAVTSKKQNSNNKTRSTIIKSLIISPLTEITGRRHKFINKNNLAVIGILINEINGTVKIRKNNKKI